MSEISSGGPAFPVECDWINGQPQGRQTASHAGWHEGMTLRDYFAARALSGLIGRRWEDETGKVPADVMDRWARAAYLTADAMLKAREA